MVLLAGSRTPHTRIAITARCSAGHRPGYLFIASPSLRAQNTWRRPASLPAGRAARPGARFATAADPLVIVSWAAVFAGTSATGVTGGAGQCGGAPRQDRGGRLDQGDGRCHQALLGRNLVCALDYHVLGYAAPRSKTVSEETHRAGPVARKAPWPTGTRGRTHAQSCRRQR
jgi:hypothetical protein